MRETHLLRKSLPRVERSFLSSLCDRFPCLLLFLSENHLLFHPSGPSRVLLRVNYLHIQLLAVTFLLKAGNSLGNLAQVGMNQRSYELVFRENVTRMAIPVLRCALRFNSGRISAVPGLPRESRLVVLSLQSCVPDVNPRGLNSNITWF